jgi:hypothetical protein
MRRSTQLLAMLVCAAAFVSSAFAGDTARPRLSEKITQANSVFIDCVCPRELAEARDAALHQLQDWGRFRLAENHRQADLIFLFSGNPYLGDYLTRDGPDKRPVAIKSTIMTVIDPETGQSLWTDSREWGAWRVKGATKDLIDELRHQMEDQTAKWSLNDVLMCSVTPVYAGFVHLTPDEALAKSDPGAGKVSGTPDHLMMTSPDAPGFCKRAQLILNPDHRIFGFEVNATPADDLDVSDVLLRADQFDFIGGKFAGGGQVYFTARSKDRKVLIQYEVVGHRLVLSRVSYFY